MHWKHIALLSIMAVALTGCVATTGSPPAGEEHPVRTLDVLELDAVYVPSHPKAVEAMLKLAAVTNGDYVIDLGCGDGRIVIGAARSRGARGVGVDLDPERVRESQRNARAAGVVDRVEFREADIMEMPRTVPAWRSR